MATYPLAGQKVLWRLLEALRRGERLSTLSALMQYRCGACSQRMGELRTLGWNIKSESVPNEGDGYHYEYFLGDDEHANRPANDGLGSTGSMDAALR